MAGLANVLATYCVNTAYKAITDVKAPVENGSCECERKCVRKLGKAELGMKYYEEFSDGTIGCLVTLSSQMDLKNSHWISAFEDVIQRYPMLGMTIGCCDTATGPDHDPETLYFKQIPNTDVLKHIVKFHRDRKSFPTLPELLRHSFDRAPHPSHASSSAPVPPKKAMWRAHILHEFDQHRDTHIYTLGISFSHTVVDGTSLAILLQHLLSHLNGSHIAASISSSLPPPVEKLVPFTYLPWPIEQISNVAIKALFAFRIKPWSFLASIKAYLASFPPPMTVDESVKLGPSTASVQAEGPSASTSYQNSSASVGNSQTYQIPELDRRETLVKVLRLSQKETAYFLRRCKQQDCSVTAALATCAAMALSSLIQGGNFKINKEIITDVTVDLRKYMIRYQPLGQTQETADTVREDSIIKQVFCATPLATVTLKNNIGKMKNMEIFDYFWAKARTNAAILSGKINSGEVLRRWNLRQKIFCKKESVSTLLDMALNDSKGFGRHHHLLLTNLGNIELGGASGNSTSGVSLNDVQFGVSGTVLGNVFMNYVATINGQLVWNLCYFDHITHDRDADTFINLIKDIIVRFAIQNTPTIR